MQLFWSLVIVAVIVGLGVNRPGLIKLLVSERSVDVAVFHQARQESIHNRVQDAAQVLYMQNMSCPESLKGAVDLGLIAEAEARRFIVLCDARWGIRVVDPDDGP